MNKAVKNTVIAALIAALYTVLTLVLAPLSFGPIQVRVSEMLAVLPVFTPVAIPGLTLGCFLSNAIGIAIGANSLGLPDMLFGTVATLIAAILAYLLRRITIKGIPFLSVIPSVIVNAVVIGIELHVILQLPFWISALQVGVGQAISCVVLGVPFMIALYKTNAYKKLFI